MVILPHAVSVIRVLLSMQLMPGIKKRYTVKASAKAGCTDIVQVFQHLNF